MVRNWSEMLISHTFCYFFVTKLASVYEDVRLAKRGCQLLAEQKPILLLRIKRLHRCLIAGNVVVYTIDKAIPTKGSMARAMYCPI